MIDDLRAVLATRLLWLALIIHGRAVLDAVGYVKPRP